MAPSVELWQPEASHMGNIAEQMIARDYQIETRPDSLAPRLKLVPTVGEFVDNGLLKNYKQILRFRHPIEVDQTVLDKRHDFKIPDMSTWHGEYRERTYGVSHLAGDKQGHRNEHYEIKPDNDLNIKKGQNKLNRIALDYRDLGLTNLKLQPGYQRGTWYPPEARKYGAGVKSRRIRFSHVLPVPYALKRKLERWEKILTKILGAPCGVRDFWLDVVRRQPGLLLYKICFDLEVPDDCTEAMEDMLAAKLVRLVYEHLFLGLTAEEQKKEIAFVNALRTVRPQPSKQEGKVDPKIEMIRRALDNEAKFNVTFGEMVDEIRPLREQLRQSLLTRNRGIPGDIYLICCDQSYFNQQVTLVRKKTLERNMQMLRNLYGPSTPDFPTGFTLTRAGILTGLAAVDDITSGRLTADIIQWSENHKTEIIIGVTIVVALTAATLIVVTAGAATPLAVPLTEAVLVESAIAAETAVGAGIATAGTAGVVTSEGTVIAVGATGASEAVGTGIGIAVDSTGLTQAQVLALRFGIGMRQAQAAAAIGQKAASSAALSDSILLASGSSGAQAAATKELSMNVLGAALALSGSEQERTMFARSLTPAVLTQWRDAIIAGDVTVAALSSAQLVTTGTTTSQPGQASSKTENTSLVLAIGKLFLLKTNVQKANRAKLPSLEQEFDCTTLSDEYKGRLFYLGFIRCE